MEAKGWCSHAAAKISHPGRAYFKKLLNETTYKVIPDRWLNYWYF
jgi:hypothetical protein